MFIDWTDGEGEWHTIPEPSYNQTQIIYHRLTQVVKACGEMSSFSVSYDTKPEVEFYIHEILRTLKLDPDEMDMTSIMKLLIDPGLILRQKVKKKEGGSDGKGASREELIAGLWLGCESLSDVMLLLDNFTTNQVMDISDARARMRDPERYRKNQFKEKAKQKLKDEAKTFAEKHGIEIKGKKKTKDSGKTDVSNEKRKQRAAELIERNKIGSKKPKTGTE